MSKLISYGYKKLAGFSLLELMVVVAILGVLATVAVPRFNIFRARARQSEAKTNLGVIFTLQEAFQIEHEEYYNGEGTTGKTWGGTDMNGFANRDGYQGAGSATCDPNKLGFRLANCAKARYAYWMAGANESNFLTVSFAASDVGARIFPGCDGLNQGITRTQNQPDTVVAGNTPCSSTFAASGDAPRVGVGDAWCMDEGRNLHNYYDIVEGCDG